MDSSRFKRIIEYSSLHKEQMQEKVKEFYTYAGMDTDKEVMNIMQIARPLFTKRGYIVIELPIADDEIGALCCKGNALGYTLLNTSLPKVNMNFALCHELYHIFYQKKEITRKVELLNEDYYEYEEEFAANMFAGMLLMPEHSFKFMYRKFQNEMKTEDSELSILVKLMNYYEVPYMATLIRSYELQLLDSGEVLKRLMEVDSQHVKHEFMRLWLDESILNPTLKDDYAKFEYMIQVVGKEYQAEGYVNERTVNEVLHNLRALYKKIKGE